MNTDIEAIILVGGKGTRLKKIIKDRPKPLAPINGRPFLEWLLISLRSKGLSKVTLATGYLGEMIEGYFGDGSNLGIKITYSQEATPLGTGGAARLALGHTKSNPILILNGDSFCKWDLTLLKDMHFNKKALATIWLTKVSDSSRFGSVKIAGDNQIIAFAEKDSKENSQTINGGVYLIQRKCLESISLNQKSSLEYDLFPRLVGNKLFGVVGGDYFLDIGTPESYQRAPDVLNLEEQFQAPLNDFK